MSKIITEVDVIGHNKKHVWIRLAWKNGVYRILTLDRSWLPRGMASAEVLKVEYDPQSVRSYTEEELRGGFTGEVKILDVIRRQPDQGSETDGTLQGPA